MPDIPNNLPPVAKDLRINDVPALFPQHSSREQREQCGKNAHGSSCKACHGGQSSAMVLRCFWQMLMVKCHCMPLLKENPNQGAGSVIRFCAGCVSVKPGMVLLEIRMVRSN